MIRTKPQKSPAGELTTRSWLYQKLAAGLHKSSPFFPSSRRYNLTICEEKKILWFRVAKVGTRSILSALQDTGWPLAAEHATRCYYPRGLYSDYFKFAFVRNPWDRLVSCWSSKVLGANYFNFPQKTWLRMQKFENFVGYTAELNLNHCDQHLRRQYTLIDLDQIDFLGRFESFEQDWLRVSDKIGLTAARLERLNQSARQPDYRTYYTDAMAEQVYNLYNLDIRVFGYRF